MSRPWRAQDKGTPAPSWHSFTRCSWTRTTEEGWHRLVLRNMSNDWSYRVPFRGSEYQVRLFDQNGDTLLILTGTNWQDIVQRAKQWSVEECP